MAQLFSLGVMATKDTSKPLGPAWAIAAGLIFMLIGLSLFIFVIISINNGEIWRFSRRHPGLVSRAASPGQFWLSAAFSFFTAMFIILISGRILRDAFRKLHK